MYVYRYVCTCVSVHVEARRYLGWCSLCFLRQKFCLAWSLLTCRLCRLASQLWGCSVSAAPVLGWHMCATMCFFFFLTFLFLKFPTWDNLELPRKREPQLKKCLGRTGLWPCLWEIVMKDEGCWRAQHLAAELSVSQRASQQAEFLHNSCFRCSHDSPEWWAVTWNWNWNKPLPLHNCFWSERFYCRDREEDRIVLVLGLNSGLHTC